MTIEEMEDLFKHADMNEYAEFNRVQLKYSDRRDLHAMILLDKILPGTDRIISSAAHDQIYLSPDLEQIAARITKDQIIELIRCGVGINMDSFHMFV